MIQPVICPSCRRPNPPRARFCTHCGHDVILNNAGPRYVITRVIKEGGQGAVYEAADEAGAVYAVKEMLDRFTDPRERAEAVARFEAEAATLRRLSHPRIPRVYASFNDEGRHYLVMDFVRGEDLDEIVAREGPQPEDRVLAWAAELCDVLGYLHGQGVIYRDLKPSNIMLELPAGTLKLIDFGIAKVFQPQARGTQIGTPGYAPPEQYQGLATKRSDIYAFGATLHHLLTGRDPQGHPPFSFPPVRAVAPAVSARAEAALARALQMRQEDRFQSVGELCAALLPAPAGQVLAPAPAPTPARTAPTTPPVPPTAAPTAPPPIAPPAAPTTAPTAAPPAPTRPVPAARPRRRRGCGALLALLALLLAAGAGAFWAFDQGLLAPPAPAPAATAGVLVARTFTARDIELVVPAGAGPDEVNRAFAAAFVQLARLDCACEPQVEPGTLVYLFDAGPRQVSVGADGARYRASLQATILVPEP
ncbi:MAG TPA: serine/threonine-protein kinase [Chloroflexaceae bacterium]|nr:serine/threonine-protein kinase [Chloroflexaceae bacterium]